MDMQKLGIAAKDAAYHLATSSTAQKNQALSIIADELEANIDNIVAANEKDLSAARTSGLSNAMLDRLMINALRLKAIAKDVRNVISLADPIGNKFDQKVLNNGMELYRRCEPIGVIGVIYEARPNVTIDIASLCLKTGNASILRGGRETLHSNMALVKVIQTALKKADLPICSVQYIENPDRELVAKLLKMDEYIDMIIPRGGASLHKMCKETSNIPVIIGGFGVSHMYVDSSADVIKAVDVIMNAKIHRPAACNALDTLLVNEKVAEELFTNLVPRLNEHNILAVIDKAALPLLEGVLKKREAKQEDFGTEWLDYTLAIKLVENVDQALDHMRAYNANHSDAILTADSDTAAYFINKAGSAAVYVNASTRFTDGGQFGLGAEVAVSTQKLHARGPMGLAALTTYKWVGTGDYLSRS